ncbi:WD40 repeat-like protein [Xylona heveae TC161]|uniref:WD40 repeat-like protein n=1 Tax=Xylona heveae (strain CBS 132557 / TC161) TaxID=1328760 RepID=A0A165AHG6_XYLHT|nr:WD40 repeat-like protein [Xylona heveae TC161]KZF20482.1 WD40 repeat-like protein [Xylona heveae TC161]
MQLLGGQAAFARILAQHLPGARQLLADDEDEGFTGYGYPRPRRGAKGEYPKVPSDTGRGLMMSGVFGRNESFSGTMRRRNKVASRLLQRELGLANNGRQRDTNRLISQDLIPSSKADTIIHYGSRCYSGQFSDDGNFFFSCAQDFRVRMYDTSNPYRWKYYKTVLYPSGQWTITDASLSPDNKLLAYSSIRNVVCLAPTDPGETGDPWHLDFSDNRDFLGSFGIWSIRFSGDGREIVAGTSDQTVRVYDIESRRTVLKVRGHADDVNAVCFGDSSSPHILYSGSDDTTLKVWDRRSMGDNRGAGVFLGHTEGLTYVDSKGDGRYVLSNSKDQTMKLWDLRKMSSPDKLDNFDPTEYSTGFDYRFEPYVEDDYTPHPRDGSLVTFRGHRVLKTLIRCHFSPPGSTDSRYVYSGSEDGSVYVYNMDATLAGKIDVNEATRTAKGERLRSRHGSGAWKTCVRDASWHPYAPVIAATSWNGWRMASGTCTLHSWNDGMEDDEAEPKMGTWLDSKLQDNEDESFRPTSGGVHTRSWARAHVLDEDDEDSEDDFY